MKDATYLLLLVDRSGSMNTVKEDANGAIATFIEEQKQVPGECHLTLIDWDARRYNGELDWYETKFDGPIASFESYELEPRGMTALYDAVGRGVTELGERLAGMPEDERPNNVIVIIQTDGGENSSEKYSLEQVKALIEQQTSTYNWSFIYLGMGADTWEAGANMGVANNIRASGSGQSYGGTYSVASASVTQSRVTGQSISGLDEDIK